MSRTTAEDTHESGFRLSAETRPGRLTPSTIPHNQGRDMRRFRTPTIDDRLDCLLASHPMCLDDAAFDRLRELRVYGESLCKIEKGGES